MPIHAYHIQRRGGPSLNRSLGSFGTGTTHAPLLWAENHAMPFSAASWRRLREKCLGVNAAPSRAERSAAAARPYYRQSCALIPEYAHPQPLPPLRCAPRWADLSIISRSSARPRKAEQEGATIVVRGEGCMTSDIALSARPKASGRLVHYRSFLSSGVSAANPVAGAVQLADPSSECSCQSLV